MKTLRDLYQFIEDDSGLSSLLSQVDSVLSDDPAHDLDHSLRVAIWTCRIGEADVSFRDAIAAALCHDIVNFPKNSPQRAKASLASAQKSREILPALEFDRHSVSEIADAIRDHSYMRGAVPESALGRALQDADRLDALGSVGIMRNVGTAIRLGGRFFDQKDPWSEHRSLNESAFAIDHYFTKLLKLPDTMCTKPGRVEAKRRLKTMTVFLDGLANELLIPRPRTKG